jgi:hypothetical protein
VEGLAPRRICGTCTHFRPLRLGWLTWWLGKRGHCTECSEKFVPLALSTCTMWRSAFRARKEK